MKTLFGNLATFIHSFIHSLTAKFLFLHVTSVATIIEKYPVPKEIVHLKFFIWEKGGQERASGQGRKSHQFSCRLQHLFSKH